MPYATDPDHVIAVTTIVSNQRNSAREGQNTEKHTVDGRRVSLALLRARQPTVSILCPTAFNALQFPKLFQRSRRAIHAGVIVAKLLSKLRFVPSCSRFGYRTLNQ